MHRMSFVSNKSKVLSRPTDDRSVEVGPRAVRGHDLCAELQRGHELNRRVGVRFTTALQAALRRSVRRVRSPHHPFFSMATVIGIRDSQG